MDKLWETLVEWGIETRGTLERMCGDYAFYRECLTLFVNDSAFHTLRQAVEERDCARAFDAAHTLKGVAGNLGLVPFLEDIAPFVETLRDGSFGADSDLTVERLFAHRAALDHMLDETILQG